jgi:RNA polymerase sigma factor (sigma-70 family)
MPIALGLSRAPALRSQAARDDVDAFGALYERHHASLHRYLRSILRDDEDARDALQSTMAKALAALRNEQRDFELRPWLFRIAHNEAISRLRQRRPTVSLDAAHAVGTDSLAQAVEDRERLALLRADLQSLPERQRAALVLRELSGLSHEEIAAVLDSSPGAVKQTIFEARVALQDCAQGREMLCVEVQRRLSDGDGRVLRARKLRAHVRSCASCKTFKAALAQRPADLAALAPALPAAGAVAGAGFAAGGAGGGVAAGLATKAAIVVVATAAIAGAGAGVRDVVARPDAGTPPAKAAPPEHHPRALPTAAPAALVRRAAPTAPDRRPAVAPRRRHPHPGHSAAAGHQATSAHAQGSAGAAALDPGQAKRTAGGKPVPPGQASKAASRPPGQARREAAGKAQPPAKKPAAQRPAASKPAAAGPKGEAARSAKAARPTAAGGAQAAPTADLSSTAPGRSADAAAGSTAEHGSD